MSDNYVDVVSVFNPDPEPLMAWLRANVDQSILEEISAADYGQCYDECLRSLTEYQSKQIVPDLSNWAPQEMLELIRWSQPDDPAWKPGNVGRRGYLMRTYACALLMLSVAEPKNRGWEDFGQNSTIIQLIDGTVNLGEPLPTLALQFLAWCTTKLADYEIERIYLLSGTLLLALIGSDKGIASSHIDQLVNELIALQRQCHELAISDLRDSFSSVECIKGDLWRKYIAQYLAGPPSWLPEPSQFKLLQLAELCLPPS